MKKQGFKQSFSSRKFKMGGFQTLTMVIVLIVVVVLNLLVGKLNITVDLSSDKIYSLTDDTKNMANELQDDITIYYMVQSGKEATPIEKVLDEYEKLGHISIEKKDPVIYPNFSKTYTDDEISDNDVIVVNETKNASRHVSYSDMYVQDMDYSTYSQTNSLDAEGQITAAIQGVTSAESKKLYVTSGHGETDLGSDFTDILTKSNMTTETLDTSKAEKIPEDSDILIINGPKYDFNEEEYKILNSYLQNGGKAMFFMNPEAEDQPNYKKLLSAYGVDTVDGYVVDTKQCMSANYPTIICPSIKEHDITADVKEGSVFQALAVGMTSQKKVRSTLSIEPLLQSSDASYSRVDPEAKSIEKIDSDISGPFNVAVAVTDTYSEKTEGTGNATKLVVYGCYFDNYNKTFITSNQFGNRTMLLNSLNWLVGSRTNTLAIPTRSLDTQTVKIEDGDRVFWTAFLVVVVPLALLGIGFVIWYRRRKR
ncbi:MAG: GldG family protein [Eubacterium sp.]|nr:GldG family protein [Eubacterium sp.]